MEKVRIRDKHPGSATLFAPDTSYADPFPILNGFAPSPDSVPQSRPKDREEFLKKALLIIVKKLVGRDLK
jgi:hypothetical protein